jgi:hypothetical protein
LNIEVRPGDDSASGSSSAAGGSTSFTYTFTDKDVGDLPVKILALAKNFIFH